MMTREIILKEGLLEQYLLGDLDSSIQQEVEQVLQKDSRLQDMYSNMERDFEQLSLDNSIAVPKEVKTALLKSLKTDPALKRDTLLLSTKYKLWFRLAAAAVVILFLNTIVLIVENGNIKQNLTEIENETTSLKAMQHSIETAYNKQEQLLAFLSDPNTKQYTLEGNIKMLETRLVSYVNHDTKVVMVNTSQLKTLDTNHDYQMWADVEGKMINMGVIDLNEGLLAMNYIEQAESFNLTIEPKGGAEHPTVSNLISNTYLR